MAFSYYKTATIQASQCGTVDNTDFTAVVCLDGNVQAADLDLRTVGNGGFVQSGTGLDIRFYLDSALSSLIPYKLVYYDASTGKLEMKLKLQLSHTVNLTIYMAFGDASIVTDGSSTAAFDTAYQAVLDFGDGTTLTTSDSTSNANNFTNNGGTAQVGEMVGGVGMATVFHVIAPSAFDSFNYAAGTIEFWGRPDGAFNNGTQYFWWGNFNSATTTGLSFQKFVDNNLYVGWLVAGVDYRVIIAADASNWPQNSWVHYVFTWASTGASILYANGVQIGSASPTTVANVGAIFLLGSCSNLGGTAPGRMDELRISNVVRNSSWVAAAYNNQKASSTFISWGAKTAVGASSSPNIPYSTANPRGLRPANTGFDDKTKLTLLGQDLFFGEAGRAPIYDFPNPRGLRHGPYTETNDRLLDTLSIIQSVPFFQLGHPNPRGSKYPQSLRTFAEGLKVNLAGKDTFFYGSGIGPSYNLPNPRGLRRNDNLRNFTSITLPSRIVISSVDPCSWAGHFSSNGWVSIRNQIDAGYPIYAQPALLTGYYEEVIDYGTVVTNTIATIRWSQRQISGSTAVVSKLSSSLDGNTYSAFQTGTSIFFSSLRFIKVRFEFTSTDATGLLEIQNLQILLDVKREVDSGSVNALSTDVTGTPVLFNKAFKDIDSITLTAGSTTPVIVVYDFVDIPNPSGFSVYAFNNAGVRISFPVSWKARGIV